MTITPTRRAAARCFAPARLALAAALPIGLAAGPAAAQASTPDLGRAGYVIVPQSRSIALDPHRPGVDIDAVEARIAINDQTASTTIEVALVNGSSRQEEAVLLLPVPDGAVVSAFSYDGSASEPTAKVMPRDEARRLYEQIVARVKDPALLEFAGYNLVRSSVFPVPANGTQRVRLTYDHILESDGNRVDYVLPRSESLRQRRPWSISVDLRADHPISTVYSPTHQIVAERRGPARFDIRLEGGTSLDPGPFRLSCLLQRDGVTASLFAYPDPSIGGGYFLLMAGLPASVGEAADRIEREVTIVIDRSGSMAGAKMDQVREAARQVVEGLADGEAFNIIDYSTSVSTFAARPVLKDRTSTLAAREYLAAIRPNGGTNIHDALLEALRQEPTEGMLPIVLFLTDGLPTIGRTSETAIRAMVEQGNAHRRRIFTFGVGEDVNVPLLDRIAESSRATSTYVLPDEDVELEVARVFKRLYGPVFAEPELRTMDTSGAESTRLVREIMPERLPDLFDGDRLILLGQYRGEDPITFALAGNYLGTAKRFRFTFDLADATTRYAFVPRLWASRRIAMLIDQIRQAGAESMLRPRPAGAPPLADARSQELVEEILRLSTEFGILTEYTAFLATEGTDLSDWSQVRLDCSWTLADRAVATRSGVGALNQGLNVGQQKQQDSLNYANRFVDERLEEVEITAVQQMADRAFFRRGNRWVDSRLLAASGGAEPDRTVVLGSDEHRRLLEQLIGQGRAGLLSLEGEIMLVVNGENVLVRNTETTNR